MRTRGWLFALPLDPRSNPNLLEGAPPLPVATVPHQPPAAVAIARIIILPDSLLPLADETLELGAVPPKRDKRNRSRSSGLLRRMVSGPTARAARPSDAPIKPTPYTALTSSMPPSPPSLHCHTGINVEMSDFFFLLGALALGGVALAVVLGTPLGFSLYLLAKGGTKA